ncbi:hypothetical protein KSP39_PZI020316 [Platanthera zijinensis]|uniref:Uncharacterized protein n=1 Tax=Platanthera zijinensis TaxID=2320716 RepID=A0AAP0AZI5_9ASPA
MKNPTPPPSSSPTAPSLPAPNPPEIGLQRGSPPHFSSFSILPHNTVPLPLKSLAPSPPAINLQRASPPPFSSSPMAPHNTAPPPSLKSTAPNSPTIGLLLLMEAPRARFSSSPSFEQRLVGVDFLLPFLQEVAPNSMADQASQSAPGAEAAPNSTPPASTGKANPAEFGAFRLGQMPSHNR